MTFCLYVPFRTLRAPIAARMFNPPLHTFSRYAGTPFLRARQNSSNSGVFTYEQIFWFLARIL